MQNALFYLSYGFLWLISIMPFRIIYVVSDFLYLIFFYLLKYRYPVVMQNLKNSFPEKTPEELENIARKFYRHFCDIMVETIKLDGLSEKQAVKRMKITNIDVLDHYYRQNRHALVVFGHYGNWEWICNAPLQYPNYKYLAIYKPLTSKKFDQYFFKMRSKFGGKPVAMHHIFREIFRNANAGQLTATAFVADQVPTLGEIGCWATFLNQETAVFSGVERIALKLNSVVLFARMRKIKRGFYEYSLVTVCENASQFKENEITQLHLNNLENLIKEKPELWLWSHRRWKYSKEEWIKSKMKNHD